MKIMNKIESLNKIKELGLNQLPEQLFNCLDEKAIEKFVTTYKAEFYAVRDKSVAMSPKHKLNVPFFEVTKYCKENDLTKFTLNVSSINYTNNQICCGEILIHDNFDIDYILSNNPKFSIRDCYAFPDYKGTTNLIDKFSKHVKGFDDIIDYAIKYNLIGVIIEFTVFDVPLGKNNEKIVVWELRTAY